MSDAIIAKALNSTIGTKDFVGLDEIFNSHLNRLDEILQKNAEDIKDAVSAVEKISNPIYSAKDGDPIIASLSASVQIGGSGYSYSKYLVLPYGGSLKYERPNENLTEFGLEGDGILSRDEQSITFSKNAKIRVKARMYPAEGNGSYYTNITVSFMGHTEYAPEIAYTIE